MLLFPMSPVNHEETLKTYVISWVLVTAGANINIQSRAKDRCESLQRLPQWLVDTLEEISLFFAVDNPKVHPKREGRNGWFIYS